MIILLNLSYVLLWMLVLTLAMTTIFLARQVGQLTRQLGPAGAMMANPGPDLNTAVERVSLRDLNGSSVALGGPHTKARLIAFVSPGCSSCEEVATALRSVHRGERRSLEVIIVGSGTESMAHEEFRKRHFLESVPYVMSSEFRDRMNISAVPYALLLDQEGILRSKGLVNSLAQVESLLNVLDTGYRSAQHRAHSLRHTAASTH
jgi:methylamine dehydrogenase accessory protein MauD